MSDLLQQIKLKRYRLRLLQHSARALNEVQTPKARQLLCRLEERKIALSFELLTDLDTVRASLGKA